MNNDKLENLKIEKYRTLLMLFAIVSSVFIFILISEHLPVYYPKDKQIETKEEALTLFKEKMSNLPKVDNYVAIEIDNIYSIYQLNDDGNVVHESGVYELDPITGHLYDPITNFMYKNLINDYAGEYNAAYSSVITELLKESNLTSFNSDKHKLIHLGYSKGNAISGLYKVEKGKATLISKYLTNPVNGKVYDNEKKTFIGKLYDEIPKTIKK